MFTVYHILDDLIDYGFVEVIPHYLIKYELNTQVSEWAVPGTLDLED